MSVERFKRQDFMSKRRIDVVRASDYDALEAENQRLAKELKQFHEVVIPSWKREELLWEAERDRLHDALMALLSKIDEGGEVWKLCDAYVNAADLAGKP